MLNLLPPRIQKTARDLQKRVYDTGQRLVDDLAAEHHARRDSLPRSHR